MTMYSRTAKRGFSLLELTLVLLILGMVAGLYASARVATMMDEKRDITKKRLEAVQKQISGFRLLHHRLPCPSDPTVTIASAAYGNEQRSGDCDASLSGYPGALNLASGAVPTKSIGLSDDYMYDGWGRRFRFVVAQEFTRDCAFTTYPIDGTLYSGMTIKDAGGATKTSQAIYVIVSHGINGHGAYLQSGARYNADSSNAAEQDNCDCNAGAADTGLNASFVEQLYKETTTATDRFDDMLRYAHREQVLSLNDTEGVPESCP